MNEKKTMSNLLAGVKDRVLKQIATSVAIDVSGLSDADAILQRSHSDYVVRLGRLALADLDGNIMYNIDGAPVLFNKAQKRPRKTQMPGPLPDQILSESGGHHGVVRIDPDGLMTPFTVRGSQYTVIQNKEIVNDALAVQGESDNSAEVMYAGNERGGRVFFTGVGFTPLEINFGNFTEKFDRHLVVYSGHDGALAYRVGWRFDDADAPGVVDWDSEMKKHYSGVKDNVVAARRNIQTLHEKSDQLVKTVAALHDVILPVELQSTEDLISRCAEVITRCSTSNFHVIRNNKQVLRNLFMDSHHAGIRGYTGWALYRACITLDESLRRNGSDSASLQLMENKAFGEARRKVRELILEEKGNL